jgi:hypothetical protein
VGLSLSHSSLLFDCDLFAVTLSCLLATTGVVLAASSWWSLPTGLARRHISDCGPRVVLKRPLSGTAGQRGKEAEPPTISTALDRRTLAQRNDAPLGCFLGWRFWLCRKLKYCCFLTVQ